MLSKLGKRVPNGRSLVHLDPDIRPHLRKDGRVSDKGSFFGQVGAPYGELRNAGVSPGDLFLFFGLFQPVRPRANSKQDRWEFYGRKKHIIWGWQQIDTIINLKCEAPPQGAIHHPHVIYRTQYESDGHENVLYVGKEKLTFLNLYGADTFNTCQQPLVLTSECPDCRSDWWNFAFVPLSQRA